MTNSFNKCFNDSYTCFKKRSSPKNNFLVKFYHWGLGAEGYEKTKTRKPKNPNV